MINITYIYLIENIDNDLYKVYIGKTKNLKSRRNSHKRTYGEYITYTVIDQIDSIDRNQWEPLESYWIRQFKCWDFNVVNQNEGGGGSSTRTITWGDKISKANKGKSKPSEFSDKLKQSYLDNDVKTSMCKPRIDKSNFARTEEVKHRISKSMLELNIKRSSETNIQIIAKLNKPIVQYDTSGNYIQEFKSIKQASELLKINESGICNCCKNKQKTAKGFIFKYKNS